MGYPTSVFSPTTKNSGDVVQASHVNDLQTEVVAIETGLLTGPLTLTGGQIVFPATQNASTDANTLDDYEEGTWTPTDASGAALSFSGVEASYIKVGQHVTVWARLIYPATADGSAAVIGSLPFTIKDTTNNLHLGPVVDGVAAVHLIRGLNNTTTAAIIAGAGGAAITNATLTGTTMALTLTYQASA